MSSVLFRLLPIQMKFLDECVHAYAVRMQNIRLNGQSVGKTYMPQTDELIFFNNLAKFVKDDPDAFETLATDIMDAYEARKWSMVSELADKVRMIAKLKGLEFDPDLPIRPQI